jgi:hypothetical protein
MKTKRYSNVNGKATKLSKPLTGGSYAFIVRKAGTMSAKNIAAILHRPVQTVVAAARRLGVTL